MRYLIVLLGLCLAVVGCEAESNVSDGDDDPNPHFADVKQALRALVDSGVPVYFMHGNRDFMVGEDFAEETGVRILPDPIAIDQALGDEVAELQHSNRSFREQSQSGRLGQEVLDEQTAFLVDPSPGGLVQGLIRAFHDPGEAERRGRAARARGLAAISAGVGSRDTFRSQPPMSAA